MSFQKINTIVTIVVILIGLSTHAAYAISDFTEEERNQEPNSIQYNRSWEPSVVLEWNEAMLAAIRNDSPRPTVVTRQLFMTHKAMYDSWSMYDRIAVPTALDPAYRQHIDKHNQNDQDSHKAAAVSQAAYHMLTVFFPTYEANTGVFRRLLLQLGYDVINQVDDRKAKEDMTPGEIGFLAAQAVMAAHEDDGSNAKNDYEDIVSATFPMLYAPVNSTGSVNNHIPGKSEFNPNRWQPLRVPNGSLQTEGIPDYDNDDPSTYNDQTFLTPHWGAVKPFAMSAGNQFRPPAPPQVGSSEPYTDALGQTMTNDAAYHAQVDQVVALSANLTDYQKVLAEFWADGPRSETPPGHWNQLSQGVARRDQHSLGEDVKLFFALNSAIFDAGIAGWEAKRAYDYIRPVSAIRHKYYDQPIKAWGGPNQGTQTILGQEWRPYQALDFVTPPFPEYISGHSIFSAASAEVLTRFTGSNRFYDGKTVVEGDYNGDGIRDMLGEFVATVGSNNFEKSPSEVIILRWPTFQNAAIEAGISRLYGGIHIQDGNLHGQTMGTEIGEQAYLLAERYWLGEIYREDSQTDVDRNNTDNGEPNVLLMGDVDCSGAHDSVDSLMILQYDVGLISGTDVCVPQKNMVYIPACDVNDDDRCTVVDALFIMRCELRLGNVFCPSR